MRATTEQEGDGAGPPGEGTAGTQARQIDGQGAVPLVLVGATGVGKSGLAQQLAEATGAEIVGCDSVQIYRGFDIGSAKPGVAARARVPHHLVDVVPWDGPFDAQRYQALAATALDDIARRGRRAIVCGGTGLYVRALRYGLAPTPPPDPALRARLAAQEATCPGSLHRDLTARDPASAARLHPANRHHVQRALELVLQSGETAAALRARHGFRAPVRPLRLVHLQRGSAALRARIGARLDRALKAGWVAEVVGLLAAGVPATCRPMQAVGYREIVAMLQGQLPPAQLRQAIELSTWHYARRQRIWWRREAQVETLDLDAEPAPLAALLDPGPRA